MTCKKCKDVHTLLGYTTNDSINQHENVPFSAEVISLSNRTSHPSAVATLKHDGKMGAQYYMCSLLHRQPQHDASVAWPPMRVITPNQTILTKNATHSERHNENRDDSF